MNSIRSNNLSLIYQRFTISGCKDIEYEYEFLKNTQFISAILQK